MRILAIIFTVSVLSCSSPQKQQSQKKPPSSKPSFYELRTYYAAEGKLEDLLTRFRDHTTGLFEKQGMVNIGYWLPLDTTQNQLIYLLGYESKSSREVAWEAFRSDPDWIKAKTDSEINGKLVDSIQNSFLIPTSYSPELTTSDMSPRVFEMRIYYTHEGKLSNLHSRFKNHTMSIFEKNNMSNVAYFNYAEGQEEAKNTLLYLISHADREAADKNWERFVKDPEWQSVYQKSIENGKLVASIDRVFMQPVDFSPLR